jgi:hypothetical protein
MPSAQKDVRHRMSVLHENYVSEALGGTHSRGSGNQAANPSDGRQDHHTASVAFSWDCKATIAQSISVKVSDWEKIVEQSLGERPMLPIRLYSNDRLTAWLDLFVLAPDDFLELLDENRRLTKKVEELEAELAKSLDDVGYLITRLPEGEYYSW